MTRKTTIAVLAASAALLAFLAGCSSDVTSVEPASSTASTSASPAEEDTEPEPSNCKPLKKAQLNEIASGKEGSTRVKSGVWVPLSGEYRFGFNQVVAVRLSGGSVATFATKNLGKANHGLLIAINRTARKHFAWAQT